MSAFGSGGWCAVSSVRCSVASGQCVVCGVRWPVPVTGGRFRVSGVSKRILKMPDFQLISVAIILIAAVFLV